MLSLTGWLLMMVAFAGRAYRAHLVVPVPAAIDRPVALVIGGAVVIPVRRNSTTRRKECWQPQTEHANRAEEVFHLGTALVSVSCHSRSPKGAPTGSATTATIPPCRSTRGSTSTRPPRATTLAAVFTASWTRM
jgi:hypothetical protein